MAIQMLYQSDLGNVSLESVFADFRPQEYLREEDGAKAGRTESVDITEAVDFGDSTEYRFRRTAYDTLGHFSKSIEEFLEMLGNTLLWVVFLQHLSGLARDLRIRFVDEG